MSTAPRFICNALIRVGSSLPVIGGVVFGILLVGLLSTVIELWMMV